MPRCIVLVDATYNAYGMLEMAYCILSLGIKIFKKWKAKFVGYNF